MRNPITFLLVCLTSIVSVNPLAAADKPWKKHVAFTGGANATCVAADFTGDKRPDIIVNSGGKTRLLVAPNWREIVIGDNKLGLIHSEVMDVDRDGDPDFIGARYSPGLIYWLECPKNPTKDRWRMHVIDRKVNGIHGLLVGDVDKDGQPDLLANSAQPVNTPFPNSLVWYKVPKEATKSWKRTVLAKGDAPGLSHYLGLGDVNGDGRPDVASGAKGAPSKYGNWFAWWEAPQKRGVPWKKHLISDKQIGATNIHPADVNGDGKTDFIASRGHGRGVVWFEGPDWKMHTMHKTLHGPHCLVVVDIDGDGDVDAATCAKDDKQCVVFLNDGKGNFKTQVIGRNQAAYDIRALDMDNDGDLDILVAGQASRNVVWYQNPVK